MKKNFRHVLALLLVLVMSLSLMACQDAGKKENTAAPEKTEEKAAEKAEETKDQADKATEASEAESQKEEAAAAETSPEQAAEDKKGDAELEKELIVYSTHPEDMLTVIADKFEEKTGVKVEFINLKGALAERVRSEKDNPQADIMYGGSVSLYSSLAKDQCFAKVEPSWANDLPENLKSPDSVWYATMQTPVVFFYNSEKLAKEDVPKTWADLADPRYEGKICSRDGLSSSQRATVASILYTYDKKGEIDAAWDYLKKLDANTKSYYNSGSQHFQAVGKGEAPVSYGVHSAIIQNRDKNNLPLEIVIPEDGAVLIPDGVAAINKAPHPAAAAAFVEFVGSEEVQAMLANQFQRYPVLKAATKQGPDWMQVEMTAMDIDWAKLSEKEGEWIQKWEDEIRSADKDIK